MVWDNNIYNFVVTACISFFGSNELRQECQQSYTSDVTVVHNNKIECFKYKYEHGISMQLKEDWCSVSLHLLNSLTFVF